MYAICLLRYRKSLEDILPVVDAHRAYLATWRDRGVLLASGPLVPRYGGALLVRVPEGEDVAAVLEELRDGDPFVKEGVAQYELLPWAPVLGKDALDRL